MISWNQSWYRCSAGDDVHARHTGQIIRALPQDVGETHRIRPVLLGLTDVALGEHEDIARTTNSANSSAVSVDEKDA